MILEVSKGEGVGGVVGVWIFECYFYSKILTTVFA